MGRISHPRQGLALGVPVRSCSVDLSHSTCLLWKRTQPTRLNIDDFNQRIKVHDRLGNLVLQFLQQHHQTLIPHAQEDEMIKKYNNLQRAHELASQRTSPPSTMTSQKDDAELVTPPPVNHSQSSTPTSSLPTASAATLDGRSFDVPSQQQPRIIQSLHGLSTPPSKQACSPCTARLKTSSSTTPGPVISHVSTSSRLLLLLPCHR